MHVFISWHSEKSLAYAERLKDLIENCIQSIKVFCSSLDIHSGDNWSKVLFEELSSTKYGIVCLTRDNIKEPWINFEAGAISNILNNKMTAILIDLKPSDLSLPLSLFQATKLEKQSILNMILAINETLPNKIERSRVIDSFELFYESFEKKIQSISIPATLSPEVTEKNLKQIFALCQENNFFLRKMDGILPSIAEDVETTTKTDFQKNYDILNDKVVVFLFRLAQLDECLYENGSNRYIFKLIIDWAEDVLRHDKDIKKRGKNHLETIKNKYEKYNFKLPKYK